MVSISHLNSFRAHEWITSGPSNLILHILLIFFCPFLLILKVKSDPMTHPPPAPHFPSKEEFWQTTSRVFSVSSTSRFVFIWSFCIVSSGASHTHLDKQTRPSPIQTKPNLGAQNPSLDIKFKSEKDSYLLNKPSTLYATYQHWSEKLKTLQVLSYRSQLGTLHQLYFTKFLHFQQSTYCKITLSRLYIKKPSHAYL